MAQYEPLTIERIQSTSKDYELHDLLCAELNHRVGTEHDSHDAFVEALQSIPRGLRAMAATHRLDVSMSLDDLGWHFGNSHHKPLACETIGGLKELGANRASELFETAFHLAEQYWNKLRARTWYEKLIGMQSWREWYPKSDLRKQMEPLNEEMWSICERSSNYGLMSYWLEYARQHPERVVI